ncbi:MAG: DoxX family protein [Chitinophagaceae bacterium]|nr:MAG: DoxX family protein [Chitinophagaceae bacterium]
MSKRNRIIYWVATIWLALGMLSTAIVQLMPMDEEIDNFRQLGYPLYLMAIIGIWKIAGVLTVLLPRLPILKEWAYAGFFFAMSGAAVSHLLVGHPLSKTFPPLLLLLLTLVSWYFRPPSRKAMAIETKGNNFTTA